MLWGVTQSNGRTLYTPTYADLAAYGSAVQGQVAYLPATGEGQKDGLWPPDESEIARIVQETGEGRRVMRRRDSSPDPVFSGERSLGFTYDSLSRDLGTTPMTLNGHPVGSAWIRPNAGSSKHAPTQTITVVGATTTHTIVLNLAAGGYIHSWTFNDGVINQQMLNRGDCWTRGIQSFLTWADCIRGRVVQHRPVQGGSLYTQASDGGEADAYASQGGLLVGLRSEAHPSGGWIIETTTIPLEFDPDGKLSTIGISTGHGGGPHNPVLWPTLRLVQRLWVNRAGVENLHEMTTRVHLPWPVASAACEIGFGAAFNLIDTFDEIHAYDLPSDTDTVLSDSTPATDYYRDDYRQYTCSLDSVYEDDFDVVAGGSVIPSGYGAVAARIAGNDFAFALYNRTRRIQDALGRPSCYLWSQVRGGASGIDGDNVVHIASPSATGMRLKLGDDRAHWLPAGIHETSTRIITETWTNALAMMAANPIPVE